MATIKIERTIELSDEEISDLIVTALEGGINYWCRKAVVVQCPKDYAFASDVIASGGTLLLYDAESTDKWELTLEKFLNGVKWYCEEYGITDADDLMNDYDAGTADMIIQHALFNEIVFG